MTPTETDNTDMFTEAEFWRGAERMKGDSRREEDSININAHIGGLISIWCCLQVGEPQLGGGFPLVTTKSRN